MRISHFGAWAITGVIFLAAAPDIARAQAGATAAATAKEAPAAASPGNAMCLACHGNEGFSAPGANGRTRSLHVVGNKFEKSVHGKRQCVECHKDFTAIPHDKVGPLKVGCV